MDRRERADDHLAALQAALQGWQADMWTALPGILQSFDAAKMTASVQPAIQGRKRAQDGTTSNISLPVLTDCPVIFPAGGGYALTFPLGSGDEGLLVFGSRCIDAWWSQGGVQPQAEMRMHDLSDGFFIPGVFSQPRKLSNVSTSAAVLRTSDGTLSVSVDKASGIVTAKAPTKIVLDAPLVECTGDVHATGAIIAGFGGADQVGLQTHKHLGNNLPPIPGF